MKYSDAGAVPPCEFSAHCLRLLDDLDAPGDERAFRQGLLTDARDMQDEYLIAQLRAHVPNCRVCSAKVAQARAQRSQQRLSLRQYLLDAEARVPSTAERILSMARQTPPEEIEQLSSSQKRQGYMLPQVFMPLIQPGSNGLADGNGHIKYAGDQPPAATNHANLWLRNGFALAAAAALIFAALGVFNHFAFQNGTTPSHAEAKSWPSVMIGVSFLSSLPAISKLYNIDTASGEREQMTPTGQPVREMRYETMSPDGKDVLYHFADQGLTVYTTWQLGKSESIVTRVADSDASNAIWMDNEHILVAHAHGGVEEFDIHTGVVVEQFASLINVRLLFYHAPFLYFQNAQQTALYRSNLAAGGHEQLIAEMGGLYFTHCVLRPDGVGIYCEGQSKGHSRSGSDLYLVSGDGLGTQALSRRGILLGFAPDHTLLFLQVTLNHYQVVKLGQTPRQDRVVMNNAAPASATVGVGDALLAPDGHALVVQDSNAGDASRGVWYDDLTTQTSRELFSYLPGATGQLIGWDQLLVNGTTPASSAYGSQLQLASAA